MGARFWDVKTTTPTSSGNHDYRSTDSSFPTPDVAIFTFTRGTTTGTAASDAVICRGIATGATPSGTEVGSCCVWSGARHNAYPTTSRRGMHDDSVDDLILFNPNLSSGTLTADDGYASFVSFLAPSGSDGGGVRINCGSRFGAALRMTVTLISGVNAQLDRISSASTTTTGWEPELLHAISARNAFNAESTQGAFSSGWSDGTTEFGTNWFYSHNETDDEAVGVVEHDTDSIVRNISLFGDASKEGGGLSISSTNTTSYTTSDVSTGADAYILALNFPDGEQVYVNQTTTSTAPQALNGGGFAPQWVTAQFIPSGTVNNVENVRSSSISLGSAFDDGTGTVESCHAIRTEDDEIITTSERTNCESISSDLLGNYYKYDSAGGNTFTERSADVDSWNATGVSFGYPAFVSGERFGYVYVEEEAVTDQSLTVTSSEQVTLTGGAPQLDQQLNLSGQAVTLAAGTPAIGQQLNLSGQTVTMAAGTPVFAAGATTLTPTGQTLGLSAGTPQLDQQLNLSGQSVSLTAGTPSFGQVAEFTGQTLGLSAGTPAIGQQLNLSGQSVTLTEGTPVFAAGAAELALTGQTLSLSAGTPSISSGNAVTYTGQSVSLAAGTPQLDQQLNLSGQSVTLAAGTPSLGLSMGLTGLTVTLTQGTPQVAAGAVSAAFTGQSLTLTSGTPSMSSGNAVTYTGQSVALAAGTPQLDQQLNLSGQSVTMAGGTPSMVSGLSMDLTGQTLSLTGGTPAIGQQLNLSGQTVTLAAGTPAFTKNLELTGQAVTLTAGTPQLDQQLDLTGQSVTLTAGSASLAQGGAQEMALTGQSVTLTPGTPRLDAHIHRVFNGTGVSLTAGTPAFVQEQLVEFAVQTLSLTVGTPALSLGDDESFFDHMDSRTAKWIERGGTFSYTQSYLDANGTAAGAHFQQYFSELSTTDSWLFMATLRIVDTTNDQPVLSLWSESGGVTSGTEAGKAANLRAQTILQPDGIQYVYDDGTTGVRYWDGAAWAGTEPANPPQFARSGETVDWYTLCFEYDADNSRFRIFGINQEQGSYASDDQGYRIAPTAHTDWISTADFDSWDDLYLTIGQVYTDGDAFDFHMESVKYLVGSRTAAYSNDRDAFPNRYFLSEVSAIDDLSFFTDIGDIGIADQAWEDGGEGRRIHPCLADDTGDYRIYFESFVDEPVVSPPNTGTHVGVMTATDPSGPWTISANNPLVTDASVVSGHYSDIRPGTLFKDTATGKYRLYCGMEYIGAAGTLTEYEIHLFESDDYDGPFTHVSGAGNNGALIEKYTPSTTLGTPQHGIDGYSDPTIYYDEDNRQYHMWCAAYRNRPTGNPWDTGDWPVDDRAGWAVSYFTSVDGLTWTAENSQLPIIVADRDYIRNINSGTESTATINIGDTSGAGAVKDWPGFARDNVGPDVIPTRIRRVVNSTDIELYYWPEQVQNGTAPQWARADSGSISPNHIRKLPDGTYVMFVTIFQPFINTPNPGDPSDFEGGMRLTSNSLAGPWTWDIETGFTTVGYSDVALASKENMTTFSPTIDSTYYVTGGEITLTPGTPVMLSDQTIEFTGQTLSLTAGSVALTPTNHIVHSGQTVTLTQGSVGYGAAVEFTGQTLTLNQGTPEFGQAVELTGQAVTLTAGTPAFTSALEVTGQTLSLTAGTPQLDQQLNLAGQTVTLTAGSASLNQPGAAQNMNLGGQTVTLTQGTPSFAQAITVSGQTITVAGGSLTLGAGAVSKVFTGQTLSLVQGSIVFPSAFSSTIAADPEAAWTLPTQVGDWVVPDLFGSFAVPEEQGPFTLT